MPIELKNPVVRTISKLGIYSVHIQGNIVQVSIYDLDTKEYLKVFNLTDKTFINNIVDLIEKEIMKMSEYTGEQKP